MGELPQRPPVDEFPSLAEVDGLVHGFVGRAPGIDVREDKAEALRRLDAAHADVRSDYGIKGWPVLMTEQVHGAGVMVVDRPVTKDAIFSGYDGIVTNQPDVALGIYVADCCAVYLVDPRRRCLGLVHSGRKGSELGIAGEAVDLMQAEFGSSPRDLLVQLSPCIRPPHYEVDFVADILRDCRERGVTQIHDSGQCTACELDRYYSYRAEKGKTGRMLAFLGFHS